MKQQMAKKTEEPTKKPTKKMNKQNTYRKQLRKKKKKNNKKNVTKNNKFTERDPSVTFHFFYVATRPLQFTVTLPLPLSSLPPPVLSPQTHFLRQQRLRSPCAFPSSPLPSDTPSEKTSQHANFPNLHTKRTEKPYQALKQLQNLASYMTSEREKKKEKKQQASSNAPEDDETWLFSPQTTPQLPHPPRFRPPTSSLHLPARAHRAPPNNEYGKAPQEFASTATCARPNVRPRPTNARKTTPKQHKKI